MYFKGITAPDMDQKQEFTKLTGPWLPLWDVTACRDEPLHDCVRLLLRTPWNPLVGNLVCHWPSSNAAHFHLSNERRKGLEGAQSMSSILPLYKNESLFFRSFKVLFLLLGRKSRGLIIKSFISSKYALQTVKLPTNLSLYRRDYINRNQENLDQYRTFNLVVLKNSTIWLENSCK